MRNTINKTLFGGLYLFVFSLFFCSQATGVEPSPELRAKIIIGGDAEYPPYEFINSQNLPDGFSVELSKALGDVMGMDIEIRLSSWDKMRSALDAGEIDLLQGMSYSEERSKQVTFSPPYTLVQHAVFIRKGTQKISSIDDLSGKAVLVQRHGIMHDTLREKYPGIIPIATDFQTDALQKLSLGEYDYAIVAQLPGLSFIRDENISNIIPSGPPVAIQAYCYAASKNRGELISRVAEGLAILKKNGTLETLHAKWLGVLEHGIAMRQILRYGIFIGTGLGFILILSVLWTWSLKKKVRERTRELDAEIIARKQAATELETRQKQLIQADKMTSLGHLVAGIAHELNNPNGLILLNLPIIKDVLTDALPALENHYQQSGPFILGGLSYSRMRDELPLILSETTEAAERIKTIVDDLKDFSRQNNEEAMEPVSLNELLRHTIRMVKKSVEVATSHFDVHTEENIPFINANPQRVEQVIINLILNACQALTDKGQFISVRTYHDRFSGCVVLKVSDSGTGILEADMPHITDPFFTTKRNAGGTGLGLSISAGIVKAHRGTLEFESEPGNGTTAVLSFPALD